MDKVNLFLGNINKHIKDNEILESDYNSLEVRIAFHKLEELGVSLEFKGGMICVKS